MYLVFFNGLSNSIGEVSRVRVDGLQRASRIGELWTFNSSSLWNYSTVTSVPIFSMREDECWQLGLSKILKSLLK